jgi:endonuclease/exonuclease/phosphatase family metal-dependent hydrolase
LGGAVVTSASSSRWVACATSATAASKAAWLAWDGRLEPLDYDHVWLSRRPDRIGSRSWGSRAIRMLTWVRFLDRATGREFCVVDNHFDHRSERARRKGAKINADLVRGFDVPVIVAGDFNAGVGSAAYRTLVAAGLSDAWAAAAERRTPAWRSANHWNTEPVDGGPRIDWIFTSAAVVVEQVAVNASTKDGATPSDHWPVQALIRLS